jgi:Zn-finger nucleic acid-binding protein
MTRTNFAGHSGIVVDVCREHGTWFDRGELGSALEFVRAGGLEREADRAPNADDQAVTRALEVELSAEALRETRSVERVTQVADDLLSILFGSSRFVRRGP